MPKSPLAAKESVRPGPKRLPAHGRSVFGPTIIGQNARWARQGAPLRDQGARALHAVDSQPAPLDALGFGISGLAGRSSAPRGEHESGLPGQPALARCRRAGGRRRPAGPGPRMTKAHHTTNWRTARLAMRQSIVLHGRSPPRATRRVANDCEAGPPYAFGVRTNKKRTRARTARTPPEARDRKYPSSSCETIFSLASELGSM